MDAKIDRHHQESNEKHAQTAALIQAMIKRMDKMGQRFDKVENKIDTVAADLTAHRENTELHRAVAG